MVLSRLLALAGLLLVGPWLAACGEDAHRAGSSEALPSVRVAGDERTVDVTVSEHCIHELCAQTMKSGPTPDLGASETLAVRLPAGRWSLQVTMAEDGRECPRSFGAPVQSRADGRHTLSPVGPPGRYRVTLQAARGEERLVASFLWTTVGQGVRPEPSALLTVLVDDESGPVRSPAVELVLSNLPAGPERAEATVTVRSADGRRTTLPVASMAECTGFAAVWHGSTGRAPRAADLGAEPYVFTVEVVLDGVRHRASVTWPDDRTTETDWSMPLTFDPPLPGAR